MVNDERTVIVDRRFSGLPDAAHGGYVAGVLASALGLTSGEVRLRRPVPTGRRLALDRTEGERVELRDAEALLAEAVPAALSLDTPLAVTLAQAEAAARAFPDAGSHPFPRCFACGPERPAGDGLRIYTGPVTGRRLVAAPWIPVSDANRESPLVADELVWAALDCAQLWALVVHPPAGALNPVVTATLAARLERPVLVGEPHVVIGWPLGRHGCRYVGGAAVLTRDGEVCAIGRQTATPASWGVPLGWLSRTRDGTQATKGGTGR